VEEKRLFGEIAVQKGYVTVAQVRHALEIQREMIKSGEGHKLIGVLLVELGYLTPDQVVDVLDTYDRERAEQDAERRARGDFTESEKRSFLGDETPDPLLPPRT
jgi:hypothetical protein